MLQLFQGIPHVKGPAVGVIDIVLFGGVKAVCFYGTIQPYSACRPLKAFSLRRKLEISAEAGHQGGPYAAFEPDHLIQVMAAFGQQHGGTAFFLIAPLAANVGDRQMMVAHMFRALYIDDFADVAPQKPFLDCA